MATYSFEEGILTLIDPTLDLNYKAPFKPVQLPPLCPEELRQGREIAPGYFVQISRDKGILYAYGLIHNGSYEGEYVYIDPNGKVKGRQYYLHGNLHGPIRFYSSEGDLLSQGWFLDGKRVGEVLWYYKNGELCSRQYYKNGLRHHIQEYYYPNNILKTSMSYKNGKLNGETSLYYPDGSLDRALTFLKGKLISADIQPPHPQPL